MADLDIPSLIPLPPSSAPTPNPASTPKNPLADLLSDDIPDPIFPGPSPTPPPPQSQSQSQTQTQPIPIPPSPTDFGPFVATRANVDPLDAHDLLSFESPQQDVLADAMKDGFFDGAHTRTSARRERVVRELVDHEDEPMYWHPRERVTSPVTSAPAMDFFEAHAEPPGASPPVFTHLSRWASVTDPGALERPERQRRASHGFEWGVERRPTPPATPPATIGTLSSSPSRYDSLRRTLSRPLTSLFSSGSSPSSTGVTPPHAAHTPAPPPTHALAPSISHTTPFAPHHHSTLPPSGAPGFFIDPEEEAWDKGNWSADASLPAKAAHPEPIALRGRNTNTSPVLSTSTASLLRPYLPPLARLPRSWQLLYSLDQHGISLHTFYRQISASFDPPNSATGGCVLAVRDERAGVFGVWLGERIRPASGGYYGTGESFLWKLDMGVEEGEEVRVKVFRWTGKNEYVALCEDDYISFGGGDGRTGLYLDSAFDRGTSERCPCFDNEPLCHSADGVKGRFSCVGLEVWRVA